MVPLYFVSNEAFSGKTSICAALLKIFQNKGLNVGYMKPVGTLPVRVNGLTTDEDAEFLKATFNTGDDSEDISPIVLTQNYYREGLKDEDFSKNFLNIIENSFKKIKSNKDLVLLEGAKNIEGGSFLGISSKEICSRLNAKVILILRYSSDIADYALLAKQYLGNDFGGVILNLIPKNQSEYVNDIISPFFKRKGINLFGSIYSDKTLSSVTIKELNDLLEGKIISAKNNTDALISSFMIGAMSEEQALAFFKKQSDKAVITGGDRADVQLAALETNTKCLILTGNFQPSSVVTNRAEDLGVPIILVSFDTLGTIEKINEIIGKVRFHEIEKVDKMTEVVEKYVDINALLNIKDN